MSLLYSGLDQLEMSKASCHCLFSAVWNISKQGEKSTRTSKSAGWLPVIDPRASDCSLGQCHEVSSTAKKLDLTESLGLLTRKDTPPRVSKPRPSFPASQNDRWVWKPSEPEKQENPTQPDCSLVCSPNVYTPKTCRRVRDEPRSRCKGFSRASISERPGITAVGKRIGLFEKHPSGKLILEN
jgi:hypothetical protein